MLTGGSTNLQNYLTDFPGVPSDQQTTFSNPTSTESRQYTSKFKHSYIKGNVWYAYGFNNSYCLLYDCHRMQAFLRNSPTSKKN